MEQNISWY